MGTLARVLPTEAARLAPPLSKVASEKQHFLVIREDENQLMTSYMVVWVSLS